MHTHASNEQPSSGHKCIHDSLVEGELKNPRSTLAKTLANPMKVPEPTDAKTRRISATFSSIRIELDTTYISADIQSRSCYNQGDTFKRGSPSSTSVICSSSVTTNCYGTCGSGDVVTTAKQTRVISTLLSKVKTKIQNQYKTRPLPLFQISATSANTNCGAEGGCPWPSNVIAPNSRTGFDLYIFVTMRPAVSGVAAWATACMTETTTGRPIAGQLNINPSILDAYSADDVLLSTIEHEITHILGFSSNFYNKFIDSNGLPVAQSSVYATKSTTNNGQTITRGFFVHPTMITMFKNLTGCSSITNGVPIEEYGSSGSAGSHFDGRSFVNELMAPSLDGCGTFGRNCFTSTATFSFLEMTGWYQADWSLAVEPTFGKKMGCSFANQVCSAWDTARNGYFCSSLTSTATTSCVYHLRDKGVCDMVQFSSALPSYYQYFTNSQYGGRVSWFDFCPYQRRYMNCADKSLPKRSAEVFNSNSACFEGNLELSAYSGSIQAETGSSRCMNYYCDRTNRILKIRLHVTSSYLSCPADESYYKFSSIANFQGTIACPKAGYTILCEGKEIAPSTDDGTGQAIDPSEAGNQNSDGTTGGKVCFLIFCWGSDASSQFNTGATLVVLGVVGLAHLAMGQLLL